jgi:para-aminobenzoate synthetase component 1
VDLKEKMLRWANRFNIFCFLDNQDYLVQPGRYEWLLAAGVADSVTSSDLTRVDEFLSRQKGFSFGHLAYDLKNEWYGVKSLKFDPHGFPPCFFFSPEVMMQLKEQELTIHAELPDLVYHEIFSQSQFNDIETEKVRVSQRLSKEQYLQKIRELQEHIVRGDCYEINFCQEFYAEGVKLEPVTTYLRLTTLSPNPFSALYKLNSRYLICASPERFLTRKGPHIVSQPMKGTIKRDLVNHNMDSSLKNELAQSAKDRSENVMVVDMVRNDLSRICNPSTVKVDELFGVYTYPHVHQMISTISGDLMRGTPFSEIIRATFPMGSMTGAPKERVMELIDVSEEGARGIFSGSVGYIDSEQDFDFNVVIRSIMYRADTQYLSYQVGSGITFYSDPEKEWEECLVKGEAIRRVLEENTKYEIRDTK